MAMLAAPSGVDLQWGVLNVGDPGLRGRVEMAVKRKSAAAKRPGKTTKTTRPKKAAGKSPATPLVRVALAVSLDGYIADKRGGVNWLDAYFSPEMDFAGFMAAIGVTIMGRKTFEVALKLGMPPGGSSTSRGTCDG
jgi:hypothetical protein